MRRIIIISVIINSFTGIFAQEKVITLEDSITGSETVTARDKVILAPGFKCAPAAGETFIANIDKTLICDVDYLTGTSIPDPDSKVIDNNLPVGATPGNFNVTSLGAATYKIPIYTPPGTGGMVPGISVVYNSRARSGLFGFGWNLSGLSSVTRMVKPYYMDDEVNAINMDSNDMFAIDGNPLMLNSGTYGGNGATYKTESETFVTVTSHGTSGPLWFEAEMKNGSTIEYGNSSYSKVEDDNSNALIWNITKITDVLGNYIVYNYDYDSDTDQTYLKSVEYTGNSNTSLEPYNKINFTYEDREDRNESYYPGVNVPNKLVITKIESLCEGSNKRVYDFYYKKDYYTQLVEVEESTGDGLSLNSTIFEWGPENQSKYRLGNAGSVTTTDKKLFSGDFNGDGKADYVTMEDKAHYTSSDKWYLFLFNNLSDEYMKRDSGYLSTDFEGITVFDVDSDGDDDMYWEYDQLISYQCNCEPCEGRSSSSKISSGLIQTLFAPPPPDTCCETCYEDRQLFKYFELMNDTLHQVSNEDLLYLTNENLEMVPGDYNGDGKPEIMMLESDKSVHDFENFYVSANPNFGAISKLIIIDFNGNGKTDILTEYNGNINIYEFNDSDNDFDLILNNYSSTYHDEILPGDFNGDGKTDLLTRYDNPADSARTKILFSQGDGFVSKQGPVSEYIKTGPPHGGVPVTYIDEFSLDLIVQDFNGDGKSDILKSFNYLEITILEDYTEYHIVYTEDDIFVSSGLQFIKDEIFFGEEGKRFFMPLDNNFDGSNDLLITLNNGGDKVLEFFPNNRQTNVLSITNGTNLKQEIQYEPITNSEVFISESESYTLPVKPVVFPLKVVYKVKTYDNNNDELITGTKFQYSNLKLHIEGKGLLGFSKSYIYNETTTDSIVNVFDYDNTFFKPFTSERYNYRDEQLITTSIFTQSIHSLDNGTRLLPYISNSEREDELNNTIKEVSTTVNTAGNMTTRVSKYMNSSENETARITESYSDFNNFGSPGNASMTSTRGTNSIVRNKSFIYYISGLLQEETKDFGTSGSLETSYTYDSYGNPLTISVSDGTDIRTNTMNWENGKKRFMLTFTNPLNQTATYTYDPGTGNILTVEDHNGLITSNTYDGFGTLTETELPADQIITKTVDWSGGSENVGDLYYAKTEITGKPDLYTYFDILSREVRIKTEGFDGTFLQTDKEYDTHGRPDKLYSQYFSGTSRTQYLDYAYDNLGRVSSSTVYPQNVTTNYSYGPLETTTTIGTRQYTKAIDESGLLTQVTEPGGSITYNYNPEGQISSIVSPSGTTTITYDAFGTQDELQDIDAGTLDYDYNIFGELVKQTDAKGNIVDIDYDDGGRIIEKAWTGGETITYNYNSTTGLLTGVESTNGTEHSFTYDDFSRISVKTEEIDQSNIYTAEYEYNTSGDVASLEINNDATISYQYNNYGYMDQVSLTTTSGTTDIWEANNMNKYGIIDDYDLGSGAQTTLEYDQYGYPDKIQTVAGSSNIQDWDYDYNTTFGNITKRKGLSSPSTYNEETFTYDSQDRLLSYTVGQNTMNVSYDANGKGNIETKTDVGTYDYNPSFPHQVEEITNPTDFMQNLPAQDIVYNKINKISTVEVTGTGIDKDLTVTYGPDQQRVKTVYQDNSSTVLTKYFALGMYEKEVHVTEGTRELFYIHTPSGLSAILESTSSGDEIHYVHTDILGSYDVITDYQGNIEERLSFDPWGRRRTTDDWDYENVPTSFLFDRGFTGHQHLDDFGLINMNGRVYDPLMAMFTSPDVFIQSPSTTQNYNRYSYVLNNPLKYIDPSGMSYLEFMQEHYPDGFWYRGKYWSMDGETGQWISPSSDGGGYRLSFSTNYSIGEIKDWFSIAICDNMGTITNMWTTVYMDFQPTITIERYYDNFGQEPDGRTEGGENDEKTKKWDNEELNKLNTTTIRYFSRENWVYMKDNSDSWFYINILYSNPTRIVAIGMYYVTWPIYHFPTPTDFYIYSNDAMSDSEKIYWLEWKNRK